MCGSHAAHNRVARIDVHPAFDMDTFGNDIAVLTLIVEAPPLYIPVRLSDNPAFEAPGTSVLVRGGSAWGRAQPRREALLLK
jgi:hypothetical protein